MDKMKFPRIRVTRERTIIRTGHTRYRAWPAGDCCQIYPGPRTSIRFGKLIEGIQDFEKIRILKEQFIKEKDEKHLKELNDVLSTFTIEKLETIPTADMVNKGKVFLNGL